MSEVKKIDYKRVFKEILNRRKCYYKVLPTVFILSCLFIICIPRTYTSDTEVVPETESGGRIHTSTITVAVMPEAEEVDIHIDEKDIRIDVMRASGNGGQCVNTTDSAVRLTHYPTGIVVYSQTEKSQLQNKEKAFALLRAKLYDLELQKQQDAESAARRSQVGTGDRSEKIRTYNFPQGRITDHRIGMTLYKLDNFLDGDIDEIIDGMITSEQAEKMKNL